MAEKVVINRRRNFVRAGGWVLPPRHIQRGIPEEAITPAMWARAEGPDPDIEIEDEEPLLLVVPDLDPVDGE